MPERPKSSNCASFFGGLSVGEIAEVLKLSPQSVMRDWRLARVWLARELGASPVKERDA